MATTLLQKLLQVRPGCSDSGQPNLRTRNLDSSPPWETDESESGSAQSELLSIVWHLRRMLNTRKGSAASCLEYGLPEVNLQVVGHRQLHELARAIQRTIVQHEPRLLNVAVTVLRSSHTAALFEAADALLAYFHIRAVCASSGSQLLLRATQLPEGDLCVRELTQEEQGVQ